MERFETARDVANAWRPDVPVYCFRPEVLAADARAFVDAFPGRTAYAVKTNGEPMVLETLARRRHHLLRRRLARRVRGGPRRRAEGRVALHAPGQVADRHPPGARQIPHPHARPRPRGRGRQDPAHRARPRSRPGGDHPVRPARRARPRRLRAVARSSAPRPATPSNSSSASPTSASRSASASMSAARWRTPAPTSARSPPPPGCAAAPACRLAGLDIGGGFPAAYGSDPRRKQEPPPDTAALIGRGGRATPTSGASATCR